MSNIKNDINSTEKLLNVIRGKDEESFNALGRQKNYVPSGANNRGSQFGFAEKIFQKTKYTVGIDISSEYISLVKSTRSSGAPPALIDKKIIKLESDLSLNSYEFKSLLKTSVVSFCGNLSDCDIWAKISTDEVAVHFFNIPRVPKKQLERVIFWTAKKEGFVDESNHIYDFEVQGEIVEQGATKYSVMFYTALKTEVEKVKSYFSELGIPLAGLTIVPFAMQNIFRSKWMPVTEEIFASLFVGDNYSRIDVYDRENLVMTRGIKTGSGSSMVEAIVSSVSDKESHIKVTHADAKKILSGLDPKSEKIKGTDTPIDFTKEQIVKMIFPVWERLARQLDLTLKTSSIGNRKLEKIYILSSVYLDQSFLDYISDQLMAKVEFFDPFARGHLSSSQASLNMYDRMLISPALGLSLSDNSRTPNILYTFQEKNKEVISRRIDRIALLSFVACLIICLGILTYKGMELSSIKKEKVRLDKELSLFSPRLSREQVLKEVNALKLKRDLARQYARKYLDVAAFGEISDLTPQNVRLIQFKISDVNVLMKEETGKATKEPPEKASKETTDNVLIEGIISGSRDALESSLTQYVVKLENSKLFNQVSVKKKDIVKFKKNEVIHFVLGAKTG